MSSYTRHVVRLGAVLLCLIAPRALAEDKVFDAKGFDPNGRSARNVSPPPSFPGESEI